MPLSRKVMIVVISSIACLTILLYAVAASAFLGSHSQLEREDAIRNVQRALDALAAQSAALDSKAADWSSWDDMYSYVVDRNASFRTSNDFGRALSNRKVDLILLVDNDGRIVDGTAYDLASDRQVPVAPEWATMFAGGKDLLLQHPDLKQGRVGIEVLSDGPMIVSARPILRTDGQGPSHGTLIFARYIDEALIEDLAKTTHLALSVQTLGEARGVQSVASVEPVTLTPGQIAVRVLSSDQVAGYTALADVHGKPRLLLRVDLPRTIYLQGTTTLRYLIIALLLTGTVSAGITLALLRRHVLVPVARLKEGALRIGEGDLEYRIHIDSQDEIGQVAAAFNHMADKLLEHDARLHLNAEALSAEVHERTRIGEELIRLNQDLEGRVAARTIELSDEISERKRAQADLQSYADRLERSNRELQDFAYVASHDLQEPLRKIQAFGDRLRDRHGSTLGEQGLDYLTRMQSAAARMQSLIDGLLTYSRVTTKAQPFEPTDLDSVTREVLNDLETRIAEAGGSVEVCSLPVIDADPLQMRQLLQNLVGNALKFRRTGAPPVVRICATELSRPTVLDPPERRDEKWCQIAVEDNGIGFDEKYTDRIFQVFQRLHGRGVYEGAGIGLSVCRKIVERHRGFITAHSTPGQGSTFLVELPCHQPTREHAL